MADAPSDRRPVFLVLGAVVVSGVLAVAFLFKGPGKGVSDGMAGAAAGARSRIWPEEQGPRVVDRMMFSQDPEKSSIDLVERPPEAAKGGQAGDGALAGSASGAGVRRASEAGEGPTDSATPALSASDKSLLGGLMGGDLMDPEKAAALGAGKDGLWTKVMRGLSRYPKVMRAVLDNKYVVKGFMSNPQNAKVCSSPEAAKSYLTDLKRPRGVSHAMNVVDAVMHGDKEMPGAVFGSKLADAIMSCPSTKSIVKDQAAIGEITSANPRLINMMMDPAVMMGLTASPAVSAGFSSVQASLAPPAR